MAANFAGLAFLTLCAPFPDVFLDVVPEVSSVDNACGWFDARVTHSMQKVKDASSRVLLDYRSRIGCKVSK